MFSPRELTAVIRVLTETGDTDHSMGRLMRGRERACVGGRGVMDISVVRIESKTWGEGCFLGGWKP